MLQDLDFLARVRAALQDYRQRQRHEEDQAEEHQHRVQVQRRIKLADIRKEERTGEKDCRLQEQAAAEDEFRGGGGQSANGTLIRDAFCTAIQATSHELQYTALGCRREFREQILEMLLALLFGKRDGDAHAEAGLYALHR